MHIGAALIPSSASQDFDVALKWSNGYLWLTQTVENKRIWKNE